MATSVKQYVTGKLTGVPKLVIIWYRQNHPWSCFYCGALLDGFTRTRDHVVPRCNGAAIKDNTVSCCKPCNGLKSHVYVSNFRQHKGPLLKAINLAEKIRQLLSGAEGSIQTLSGPTPDPERGEK